MIFSSDEILLVQKNLTHLRRLKTRFFNENEKMGCISIFLLMPYLEELLLEIDDNMVCDVVTVFSTIACQMMPRLKIFGSNDFNCDVKVVPYIATVHNVDFRKIHQPCALEECVVLESSFPGLQAANFPNLRSLKFCSSVVLTAELLQPFYNLTSLEMVFDENIFSIIAPVAHQLTKLCLKPKSYYDNSTTQFYDIFSVIGQCKNLEILYVKGFNGSVNLNPPFALERSKLKKLVLAGNFLPARGFLPIIFQCPQLEEVVLRGAIFSKQDINKMVRPLVLGQLLQNLTKLVIEPKGYCYEKTNIASQYRPGKPNAKELVPAMEKFVKHIICYCPRLVTVRLGLEYLLGDEPYVCSISPFLDSFRRI